MFVIPALTTSGQEVDLFVFLEEDNLVRMKQYDPAEIVQANLPAMYHGKIRNVIIGFATSADREQCFALVRQGKHREALQNLCRGFRYRPDLGDRDNPYSSALHQ